MNTERLNHLKEVVKGTIDKWRSSKHIPQPTKAEQILYEFGQHPGEILPADQFLDLYDGSDVPQASFRATINRINDEIEPRGYTIKPVSAWMLVPTDDELPEE